MSAKSMSVNKWTKQEAWIEGAEDVPDGEAVVGRSKKYSYQIERARRMIEDDSIPWTAAEGHRRKGHRGKVIGGGLEGAKCAGASILTSQKPWLLEV